MLHIYTIHNLKITHLQVKNKKKTNENNNKTYYMIKA